MRTNKFLDTVHEVLEVILEGKEVEYKCTAGKKWLTMKGMFLSFDCLDDKSVYQFRIKPTKPSIDWNRVSDEFNFLARDKDGLTWLYANKPKRHKSLWGIEEDNAFIAAGVFKSLDVGNCDWTESLVERPKDKE